MVLRVILQVVPFGDEAATREIGRLDIFNKGRASLSALGGDTEYGVIDLSPGHVGLLTDSVYHYRAEGAWSLLHTVLDELEINGP